MEYLFTSESIISFFVLVILEIVLGIDNVIFVSLVMNRLPAGEIPKAHELKETAAKKIDEWDGEDKNPDGTEKSFLDKMKTKAESAWDATKEKAHELKGKVEDKIDDLKGDEKKPEETK